jgi:hypothetical protein
MTPDILMNMGESVVGNSRTSDFADHTGAGGLPIDHRGESFMLQHVTTVTDYWPKSAGLLGGARITIVGDGFSSNASAVRVEVSRTPCVVETCSLQQIVCVLTQKRCPHPFLNPVFAPLA